MAARNAPHKAKGSHASEWFSNYDAHKPVKPRFRKRVFNLPSESTKHNGGFLAHANNGGKTWEVEKGGSRWTKSVSHKRHQDAINPEAERLKFEELRQLRQAKVAVARERQLGSQIKAHGYKDILSWRKDDSIDAIRPIREQRSMLKNPDRVAAVERMKKEHMVSMRSSKSRFYFSTAADPNRQKTLVTGGLLKARQAAILGATAGDSRTRMKSFGVADAFTHSVYGGKALKPEWGLEKQPPRKSLTAPSWYGHRSSERSSAPPVSMKTPDWWGGSD